MIICLARGLTQASFPAKLYHGNLLSQGWERSRIETELQGMLYVNGMNWVRSICVQVLLLFFPASSQLLSLHLGPQACRSVPTGIYTTPHIRLLPTGNQFIVWLGVIFFCSKNIVRFIFNFIHGKHIFIHMGSMFKIIKAWATRRGVWSRAVYHGLHVYSSLYSLWLWWIAVIWYGFCLSLMSVLASLDISCPFVVPHQDLFKECWAGGWIRSAPEVLPHLIHPISPPWRMLCCWLGMCVLFVSWVSVLQRCARESIFV